MFTHAWFQYLTELEVDTSYGFRIRERMPSKLGKDIQWTGNRWDVNCGCQLWMSMWNESDVYVEIEGNVDVYFFYILAPGEVEKEICED